MPSTVQKPKSGAHTQTSVRKKELGVALWVGFEAVSYATTIVLSAFLLFQVELIMGKLLLPRFGGGPWVWSTSLLVFQVLLLAGYGYAAFVCARLSPQLQGMTHAALLLASAIVMAFFASRRAPLLLGGRWTSPTTENPVWQITSLLVTVVGLQCVLLSATSPLFQNWFGRRSSAPPYRLYALSNLGSMLGLLTYPFLVERFLTLSTQGWGWAVGYGLFLLTGGASALVSMRRRTVPETLRRELSKSRKLQPFSQSQPLIMWLALTACSNTMLLATTNLICQQVAPVPLLWVLPLSLYLLSFVICFDHSRWYRREIFCSFYVVMALLALKFLPSYSDISITHLVLIFCAALMAVCMICQGELARMKPQPQHLTLFYLMISAGGALGSAAVVLIAPQIFDRYWEFQIALLGCGILLSIALLRDRGSWVYSLRWGPMMLAAGTIVIAAGAYHFTNELLEWEGRGNIVAARTRNFFGVKTVLHEPNDTALVHGHTLHGLQNTDSAKRNQPTIYYGRESGIGLLLDQYPRPAGRPNVRVGVVGMGVGTLAAYGRAGDYFRFYEIDPAIVDLSNGARPTFTFVQSSAAQVDAVIGDARINMQEELSQGAPQDFDVLVVDAFSGDSVPVHLLTREATDLYLRQLHGPQSVIAFHLSNSALDLRPVVENLAHAHNLASMEFDTPPTIRPIWILLARDPAVLRLPELSAQGHPIESMISVRPWTDDYSSMYQLFNW